MPKAPRRTVPTTDTLPIEEATGATEDPGTPEGTATTAPARGRARKTPPQGVSSLFVPLEDQKEFARVLMYGREGSGKTTSALRAANGGRTLVLNAEGGLKQHALRTMGVDTSNVVTVSAPLGQHLTHALITEVYAQLKADLMADPDSWYAVVIDSASDIVTALVHHVSEDRIEKTRNKGVLVDEIDSWVTDRNDYGTMAKMFRDLLRKFRDLPCHLIVTALERRDVDEDSGRTMYGPSVSPSLVTDLTGYMDIVLACQPADEDKPFRAASGSTKRYRAKDRLHVLPSVMVDPFFDRIVAYIAGDLTPETDPVQEQLVPRKEEVVEDPDETD